jgi:exopolysaccharide biosynthesis protein
MIGWNEKYLYFIVVDGRQLFSIGMTYPEMAALVNEYGCVEAVELDGGGSSTIWAMGKILNSPSNGRTRAIANGLILFRNERTTP